MKMPNNKFSEHRRQQVKATQLAHGVKYQGAFYFISCLVWTIFLIMLANGSLT